MEEAIKKLNNFNLAMQALTRMGEIKTNAVIGKDTEYYKVNIIIDNKEYIEEGKDVMEATIRLRNQFN